MGLVTYAARQPEDAEEQYAPHKSKQYGKYLWRQVSSKYLTWKAICLFIPKSLMHFVEDERTH